MRIGSAQPQDLGTKHTTQIGSDKTRQLLGLLDLLDTDGIGIEASIEKSRAGVVGKKASQLFGVPKPPADPDHPPREDRE